jgi:predicted  nucleic acid-binding Zn-ribbon protein
LDASDRIAADLVAESTVRNFYLVDTQKHKPMPTILVGKQVYNTDNATELGALGSAVAKLAEEKEAAELRATEIEARAAQIKTELEESTLRAEARADAAQKEAEAAKGRADALELKVTEVESNRLDSDTLAADRKDAIETWALCLPTLRADSADFEPDYSLAPLKLSGLI